MLKYMVIVAVVGVFTGTDGAAQGIFSGQSGLSTFDRDLIRKPEKGARRNAPRVHSASVKEAEPEGLTLDAYSPSALSLTTGAPQVDSVYAPAARAAAIRHGVPVDLFFRLVKQESGWNPNAVSPKGAIGLAQLMPFTARELGVNPRDPKENLEGGARYLAEQYRRFRSWRLALAAYNAGPEAVERFDGIPPYRETQNYVRAILDS